MKFVLQRDGLDSGTCCGKTRKTLLGYLVDWNDVADVCGVSFQWVTHTVVTCYKC